MNHSLNDTVQSDLLRFLNAPNLQRPSVTVSPASEPITGDIYVPGSKSVTNRALLIAAIANGVSRLEGILHSDDSFWCIRALRALGVHIEVDGDTATVHGCDGQWPNRSASLYVGSAGTVARFLPGLLAVAHGEWAVSGSEQIQNRPMGPLLQALTELGAKFTFASNAANRLPYQLTGSSIAGGEVVISGSVSSQFISGLLLAGPYTQNGLTVHLVDEVVQRDYVEITLEMMRNFGATATSSVDGEVIRVEASPYLGQSLRLEPDVSTAGYFFGLAALTEGTVRVHGIQKNTRQPDIELLQLLERMGCSVNYHEHFVEISGPKQLKGGFTVSMKKCSDQTLTLAVIAVFADAPITLTNVAHIRHHESDRISAICAELTKLQIRVEEQEDGLTIYPGTPIPTKVDTYDDHRMAMALSLLGTRISGLEIDNPSCVAKTCPDYFDRLSAIGVQVVYG